MKKILIVASVFKFLRFEKNDIRILKEMGYEVHCATNMASDEWLRDDGFLDDIEIIRHQIDFGRTPFSKQTFIAYKQLLKLLNSISFDMMHCHTPVAAAIARFAARRYRKNGLKVIYTSHGFHFHKKSGLKNWILFFPIEYIMSFFTDMIIVINREDYALIQGFPVKEKRYIPGVGIDTTYIENMKVKKEEIRENIGVPKNAFLVFSSGELSDRKNQRVIIEALGKLNDRNIFYVICGAGANYDEYIELANKYNIGNNVILTGIQPRERVLELCHVCDVGAFPSLIEGLGLSGLEILAAGKPLVASSVHGIVDYVIDGYTGMLADPHDSERFAACIEKMRKDKSFYQKLCDNTKKTARGFDIKETEILMRNNYKYFE